MGLEHQRAIFQPLHRSAEETHVDPQVPKSVAVCQRAISEIFRVMGI